LITMRCSTLRGTFCSLITLATPRQDWTGSNPSRGEGGGCGFTLSRSHSCCAVRLVDKQISPGHIWTTLYILCRHKNFQQFTTQCDNLKNDKTKFQAAFRKQLHTHFFNSVDELFMCKDDL